MRSTILMLLATGCSAVPQNPWPLWVSTLEHAGGLAACTLNRDLRAISSSNMGFMLDAATTAGVDARTIHDFEMAQRSAPVLSRSPGGYCDLVTSIDDRDAETNLTFHLLSAVGFSRRDSQAIVFDANGWYVDPEAGYSSGAQLNELVGYVYHFEEGKWRLDDEFTVFNGR